jgi:hypothetical protein
VPNFEAERHTTIEMDGFGANPTGLILRNTEDILRCALAVDRWAAIGPASTHAMDCDRFPRVSIKGHPGQNPATSLTHAD